MNNTTAGELGNTLPVGIDGDGGVRARSFDFRPWRGKDERVIGTLRDKNRSMPPGQFATRVLAYFLTHWGQRSLDGLGDREKWHLIASSYVADVLYAWVALRRKAMGDTIEMSITCPVCHKVFPFRGNLSDLPVTVVDENDILREPYALKDGFNYLGDESNALTLEPPRWSMYENLGAEGLNIGAIKMRTIGASIVAVGDKEARVAAEQLDELTKRDLEELYAQVSERQLGPDMRVDTVCLGCGFAMNRSLAWGYESFFSATSSSDGSL